MIGNAKALGLILTVLCLAGATAAVSAAAEQGELHADGAMTLLGSEQVEEGANAFTALGAVVECPGSTYAAGRYNAASEPIPVGAEAFTLISEYSTCTWTAEGSAFSTTVKMNGCDFAAHLGTTTKAATYLVTTDIACPEGAAIQIDGFAGTSHGFKVCTLTIGPQSELTGLQATSTPAGGDFDLQGTLGGIEGERSGLCGSASEGEASIDFDLTLEGRDTTGTATSVSVIDEPPPAEQGELHADGAMTLLGSEQGEEGANAFTALGAVVECPGSTYAAGRYNAASEPIPVGAEAFTLISEYSTCTWTAEGSAFSTTVKMNGCDFAAHLGTTTKAATYLVTTDIACPEGAAIQIDGFAGTSHGFKVCTLTIGPQSELTGLQATSTPAGGDFDLQGTLGGIEGERSGLCGSASEGEASIDFDLTLEGRDATGTATSVSVIDEP